jgi:hypothetical protein
VTKTDPAAGQNQGEGRPAPPALFGPYGSSALPFLDQFERYGANALWFHGFDPAAFAACEQYEIEPCVEFKTFRADFHQRPDLVPIGVDGKPITFGPLVQGVCLSKKDFLEETANHLIEGLRSFHPRGIWLDYLTYVGWFETPDPDLQDSCFCPDCIAEFCEAAGLDASTPQQILNSAHDEWVRHKCERVAGFAASYAALIREKLPDCVIGAYLCPWLPQEYERAQTRIFAQDFTLLAPAIDVFTPLIYCTKSGRDAAWGRKYLEASPGFLPPGRSIQLILDMLEFPASLQEAAGSTVPSLGIQVFGGAEIFRDPESAVLFSRAVEEIRGRLTNPKI